MRKLEGLLLLFLIILYGVSGAWAPSGYADADELLTVSVLGSVAHPPGYLSWVFINHWLGAAFTGQIRLMMPHFIHIVTAATAVVVFFWLAKSLLNKKVDSIPAKQRAWMGLLISTLLGTSYLFWLYATTTEIFHAALLLFFGACLTLQVGLKKRSKALKWLSVCIFGLFVGHYQLGIIVLPFFGGVWLFTDMRGMHFKKVATKALVGIVLFGLGFAAYQLPWFWLKDRTIPLSWTSTVAQSSLWSHVFRADYGQAKWRREQTVPSYIRFDHINVQSLQWGLPYGIRLIDMAGVPLVVLAFGGGLYLWQKDRKMLMVLGGAFLTSGPLLALYMYHPASVGNYLQQGVESRQFLLNVGITALLAMYGVIWVAPKLTKRKLALLLIGLVAWQVWQNRALLLDKGPRTVVAAYARALLESASENSLVICATDIDCYSLFYQRDVIGVRHDVEVIPFVPTYRVDYVRARPDLYPFSVFSEPEFLGLLIGYNVPRRAVLLTQGFERYMDYYSLEGGPYYLQPKGLFLQVLKEKPKEGEEIGTGIQDFVASIPRADSRDWYYRGIRSYLANVWLYQSYISLLNGQLDMAKSYLALAEKVGEDNQQLGAIRQLVTTRSVTEQEALVTVEDLLRAGEQLTENEQWEQAEVVWRTLAFYELENTDYWQRLLKTQQVLGKKVEARKTETIVNELKKLYSD